MNVRSMIGCERLLAKHRSLTDSTLGVKAHTPAFVLWAALQHIVCTANHDAALAGTSHRVVALY